MGNLPRPKERTSAAFSLAHCLLQNAEGEDEKRRTDHVRVRRVRVRRVRVRRVRVRRVRVRRVRVRRVRVRR